MILLCCFLFLSSRRRGMVMQPGPQQLSSLRFTTVDELCLVLSFFFLFFLSFCIIRRYATRTRKRETGAKRRRRRRRRQWRWQWRQNFEKIKKSSGGGRCVCVYGRLDARLDIKYGIRDEDEGGQRSNSSHCTCHQQSFTQLNTFQMSGGPSDQRR